MQRLHDCVAAVAVAGATRGAGRGAARGLGEAGATVYCTGRSVAGAPSAYNLPETIDETAEMVTAAGGVGIPVRIDHTDDAQVRALFERVQSEQGRLDVLVDSVAGEDPLLGGWSSFWETDVSQAARALEQTVASHIITAAGSSQTALKKLNGAALTTPCRSTVVASAIGRGTTVETRSL